MTYSGISYRCATILIDNGPAQEQITGASKIPTIIYYDKAGSVRAVGAEAVREGIFETAEDEGWFKAEWFKLHLRSQEGGLSQFSHQIPSLPPNKTVIQVFGDFLAYLLSCAKTYITETHANGPSLWASVKDKIDFVLSHPNGWEGKEQAQMRKAAVLGGLIPDDRAGHQRVSFVTEGEASLHFAIENGILADANMKGQGVVIVDAGGGTVDVSAYRRNLQEKDKVFEEIAAPQCHFHGSVFVSICARTFLGEYLSDSPFVDDLEHIIRCFDKTTKLRFRNVEEPQYIKFGSTRDNDKDHDIRFGQLKLAGSDVAKFFDPSVKCVIDAVKSQQKLSGGKISHVVLVGGFAASDYLFEKCNASLSKDGYTVIRPENHINKAVSDGAISFYLDHFVRTRVSKITYGSLAAELFNSKDKEHKKRSSTKITFASGEVRIPDHFYTILAKNTQVSETKEFSYGFLRDVFNKSELAAMEAEVWAYRGNIATPTWKDIDPNNYSKLCTIVTNLSHLPLIAQTNSSRQTYYRVEYSIVLLFGLTEMQALVSWYENGYERRSPAKIVYDSPE